MIRRFNRFELKYILPVKKCERLIEDIKHHIGPDQHGGLEGYRVCSLYYDNADLEFFWNKIEGIKFRRKIRIRIYPGDDISTEERGMVEIKQRINRTVQKRRLALPLDQAHLLCLGQSIPPGLDIMDQAVAAEVQYIGKSMGLQPTVITAYLRRAFVGEDYNDGLRITFDTDLQTRIHALTVNETAKNHHFTPLDWCIMEVKVNDAVPDWVVSLLARHNCSLSRISKYCAGLAFLKDIPVMPFAIATSGNDMELTPYG